ncbi:hypothetical protein GALMADRAFT_147517 [Galerina marginata CBS 339.88]|uniref:Uncharacterized protein n=1 Tax=Galerina marginata (strain CBS 339.88) TaxID=685588 RepID=A0A067SGJ3_GALM3|nr:hypothetical protein GALMADRAFT_147517 [Galerina marginata CBS 339.88]
MSSNPSTKFPDAQLARVKELIPDYVNTIRRLLTDGTTTSTSRPYDRFLEDFIPIPTYSGVATLQDEFLILRRSSFVNRNCDGLDILIGRLNSLNLKGIKGETTKAGGKRKAFDTFEADEGQPGPSQPRKVKRRLTAQQPEVLDWTNLS